MSDEAQDDQPRLTDDYTGPVKDLWSFLRRGSYLAMGSWYRVHLPDMGIYLGARVRAVDMRTEVFIAEPESEDDAAFQERLAGLLEHLPIGAWFRTDEKPKRGVGIRFTQLYPGEITPGIPRRGAA